MNEINKFFSKQYISLYLILSVNFLFTLKYIDRVTQYAPLVGIAFVTIQFLLWRYRDRLRLFSKSNLMNLIIVFLFILAAIVIFKIITIESLMVDRWSVITSFWDAYFKGDYTYLAQSHMKNYPGPMPFYFIMAFPFYIVGELGYMSLCGLVGFYILMRYCKIKIYYQTAYLLLLTTSLFYLWEVTVRSNVFFNGLVVLLSVLFFFSKDAKDNYKHLFFSGIFIGLSLSTRNVYIIPYIIVFIYALRFKRINITETLFTGIITIATFALTFIPFVAGHYEEFKTMNPFIIQSTFLIPFGYTIGFILFAVAVSFLCKTKNDIYFYSGITLFAIISFYYLYHIFEEGLKQAFYNSAADISYYILATPFLFYYLLASEKKANKLH